MTSAEMRTGTCAVANRSTSACSAPRQRGVLRRLRVDRADDEIAAAVVRDEARLGHRGGHVDDRRNDRLAHVARDRRRVLDAVLQAEDERAVGEVRRHLARDGLGVGRLDAEEDEVGAAHRADVGARRRCGSPRRGRPSAGAGRRARSPATCAGRAISVTGWPARASIAPKKLPTAPAPTTAVDRKDEVMAGSWPKRKDHSPAQREAVRRLLLAARPRGRARAAAPRRTPTPPEQCQVTVPSARSSGAKTSAPRGLSTVRTMLSASSESWLPSASVAGTPAASSDAGGSLRSAYQAASARRAGSLLA